uniref:ATP synthase mitochondrial F1 complex assembly factor 1 n=1 Tax=Sinocyclocheilus rhinocerous TaxID=307959 RepID=A0A673J742_9TELE
MWDGEKMAAAVVQMSCLYRGMLAVRATGIRPLIPGLVPSQFRAFSMKKEPEMEENPYYSKYEEKIRKLRSSKPQEYKARLEKRSEVKTAAGTVQTSRVRQVHGERGDEHSLHFICIFNLEIYLGGLLDFDLWMQYFSKKDTISAVIPGSTFDIIFGRAKSCPTFLYTLPQKEGYEFFVGQWAGHELHFTSLINVQTMGANAPSQLILYHYTDLQKDKGILLMTAEMDSKFVTVHQAQCLANQVQLFYGSQRLETFRLVETFNHQPAEFKHVSVIAELEQSGVGPAVTTK